MTPPTTPENTLPAELPLVTAIPEINAMEMSGLPEGAEESTGRSYVWGKPNVAKEAGERLALLYLTLGEGVFTLEQVKAATGLSGNQAWTAGLRLGDVLPEEIFSYDVTVNGTFFSFGAFSIAFRKITEQEKGARANTKRWEREKDQERADAALQRKKEEVFAAEAEKTHLIQADHALITVNGREFYLPITSRGSILAIRTFQAIRELLDASKYELLASRLARMAWRSMPLEERYLFADVGILKESNKFLSQVASPLGIVRHSDVKNLFDLNETADLTIEIKVEPPEAPYNEGTVMPLFAPGTEKQLVQTNSLGEISQGELSGIAAVLDKVLVAPGFSQEDAEDVLAIIFDRRGKILARRILARQHGTSAANLILEELDQRAERALGKSRYHKEKRNRAIHGHLGATDALQRSGRLPGRPLQYLPSGKTTHFTTKWHFGIQEKKL